ncbi:MAG: hypothetical protein ACD_3C00093G0002 [uncultured bacterium (gcode 4)]|uniref:Nucleotidyltransferase family protein n=1 Tax=uncultured bacterium (gcode 4) TaxID=1234023 RepID=K2FAH8_9BACT|nr:MAG: hypothetical protein ACD_3C00093G0002 [uncultured bacterium (gcode 4)]
MNAMIARLDKQRHKVILMSLLLDISKNKILKESLVFKWWTALFLLYSLDRFSTDLDFDLIKNEYKEEQIMDEIWRILSKYWEVKDLRIKKFTIFWMMSYSQIDHNIKVEINKRWISWNYNLYNFMGIQLYVLNIEYITANKLLALTSRNNLANRDIYDVNFIIKNNLDINKRRIEITTWKSFEEYIAYCIQFLEKLWKNHNILDWLWSTLQESQKQDIKMNLINDTIFLLHSLI